MYLCMYNTCIIIIYVYCIIMCEHRYPSLSTPQQGTHKSLKENAKATATVSGIINGTGSLGKWGEGGLRSELCSLLECN